MVQEVGWLSINKFPRAEVVGLLILILTSILFCLEVTSMLEQIEVFASIQPALLQVDDCMNANDGMPDWEPDQSALTELEFTAEPMMALEF